MLVSSALVLMMTGPGLALFYSGLVRKKNVLGTMMQSFAMMAIITVTWALFSYSWPSMRAPAHRRSAPLPPARRGHGAGSSLCELSAKTYMIYQMMFAIITPALITGAFAERMKVQRDGRVHRAVVVRGMTDGPHGVGTRAAC